MLTLTLAYERPLMKTKKDMIESILYILKEGTPPNDNIEDYDVEAIADECYATAGGWDLGSVPVDEFWKIVEKHDRSLVRAMRSMFVTGCVCEGDECGGHRYTYDPPVVTREDQERGRATMAAAQAGVFLTAEDPDPGMPLIRP